MTCPYYPCYNPCCPPYCAVYYVPCFLCCNPCRPTPSVPKKKSKLTDVANSGPPGDVGKGKGLPKNVKEKKPQGKKTGSGDKREKPKKAKVEKGNKIVKKKKENKADKNDEGGPADEDQEHTSVLGNGVSISKEVKSGLAKSKEVVVKKKKIPNKVIEPTEIKEGAGDDAPAPKTICKCPTSPTCKDVPKLQGAQTSFTLQDRNRQSGSPQVCPDKEYQMLMFAGDGLPVKITCKCVPRVKTVPALFSQNKRLQPTTPQTCPKCTKRPRIEDPPKYIRTICGTCGSIKFEPKTPVRKEKPRDCCCCRFGCKFAF